MNAFPRAGPDSFLALRNASNLRTGANPSYAVSDFLALYPQFGPDQEGTPVVPQSVIQTFIDLAASSIQQARWRRQWTVGMGLFIAHRCQLWLQTAIAATTSAEAVLEAGKTEGIIVNKSAGDVSMGFDSNLAGRDTPTLAGWGDFHLSEYGYQFAIMAKRVGLGGMYVW